MSSPTRIRLVGVAVAILFSAMAGAFVVVRLLTPSDGARLQPGERAWHANSVTVTALVEQPGGLETGDLVVAVAGVPLNTWADQILDPEVPRPSWQVGDVVPYTVIRAGERLELQVRLMPYPLGAILAQSWSTLLFVLFTAIVLTVVFMLRPLERAAQVLLLLAWSNVHGVTWSLGLQVSDIVQPFTFYLYQLTASGAWIVWWSTLFLFALVFPRTNHLLARRSTLPLLYGLPFLFFFLYLAASRRLFASTLEWMGGWVVGNWLVAFAALALTTAVFVLGYRKRWNFAERKKVRWLAFGFLLCGGITLFLWLVPGIVLGQPLLSASAFGLALLPLPVILGIAVWRDALFDIDIIIRRTVTYTILIAILAIVYFASVIVLQQVFVSVINARSEIVTVLSTLAIAALFIPLRNWIQNVLDTRFYRKKYDSQQVLTDFAKTLRDETDLEALTARLMQVVHETMQPQSVSVWLRRQVDR
jgi:hypothetical protein